MQGVLSKLVGLEQCQIKFTLLQMLKLTGPIYDKEDLIDANLVLAIPIQSFIKVYDKLSEKNPGLIRINQFLEHIGLSDSDDYKKLDDMYVEPREFSSILKTLEIKKCVFIIGSAECGKTFTAIKLMWDKWRELSVKCYYPQRL